MIFNMNDRKFESEKERNLYYKFFAGFYFNELIPGHHERLRDFYKLLRLPAYSVGEDKLGEIQPSKDGVFVSFDNHVDRFVERSRGEFADVLIHDRPNRLIIGIEAKYLDNWDYEKDIVENGKKLRSMALNMGAEKSLLCLLVTETKWTNVKSRQGSKNSNFDRLKKHSSPVAIIHWEMLNALDSVHPHVRNYLIDQLQKR